MKRLTISAVYSFALMATLIHVRGNAADEPEITVIIQEGVFGTVTDATVFVDPKLANANLGGMHDIGIWQHGGVSLVRFELADIPKFATVKSASLLMHCSSVGFSEQEIACDWQVHVSRFHHDWVEGTGTPQVAEQNGVTHATFNGIDPWPNGRAINAAGDVLGSTTHKGGEAKWYEWNLKPGLVNAWISGEKPNFGMIIWGDPPGKAVSFTSSESTNIENRPKLCLVITMPLNKMLSESLGEGEVRNGIKRVNSIKAQMNPENGRISLAVDWAIRGSHNSGALTLSNTRSDIEHILMVASKLGPLLSHVEVRGSFELMDKFGNASEVEIISANYSRSTIGKINWDNFQTANVFEIADAISMDGLQKYLDKR